MYKYSYDAETGGYLLNMNMNGVSKEVRPVFFEELDMLGFNKLGWQYPRTQEPVMWAEGRRYIYKGEVAAEVNGGSLYSKPTIKLLLTDLHMTKVDMQKMIEKNKPFMLGLVQSTTDLIYSDYLRYKDKFDMVYVAFSGGKDSSVLLDLVQRVVPHNDFKVVFADTTMEIKDTYHAVEKTRERYPTLDFRTARSHLNARESWREFGIPSKALRWCCSVHKSAPSILKLRELSGKDNLKVLVYDGVRAEESAKRAEYINAGDSGKHNSQKNLHPIADWSSAEIYLYLFEHNLLLNDAYRNGIRRVGCILCPEASEWREFIMASKYYEETKPFIDILHDSLKHKVPDTREREAYIDAGNWKARFDGRDLINSGNKITEKDGADKVTFIINACNDTWREWIKPLGSLLKINETEYEITHNGVKYHISVEYVHKSIIISLIKNGTGKEFIRFLSLFRKLCNKTAYCSACSHCKVECSAGAIDFTKGIVSIGNKCTRCEKCYGAEKGCILTKSLTHTIGGKNMTIKGLGNYKGFGFRSEWLSHYFTHGDSLWAKDIIGGPKQDALKIFLRESEITQNNNLTELGKRLKELGAGSDETWAVIFINLAYNSGLFNFYVKNSRFGCTLDSDDLMELFGDKYSPSTKDNAVRTLKETLRDSPIGAKLGAGVCSLKNNAVISVTRQVWKEPSPIVVLYSLYKFSEKSECYSFTLTQLCNNATERAGLSPSLIFGLSYETLKDIIRTLSVDYEAFIRSSFSKDLDNIELNKTKTVADVLNLI